MPVLPWMILAIMLLPLAVQAQPREFRDCPDCPLMISIPPGSFTMGVPAGEDEREGLPQGFSNLFTPQTRIAFASGFALGKFTVTLAEYAAFVVATGRPAGRCDEGPGRTWQVPDFARFGRHPVACVSWDDAQAYGNL